ncbi:MAG TPA: flagellar biosynthetic protein FliO [Bacillales bacterium]|nr:flagellar biosynthetic protein FliO [Bacillales bacterium]
MRKLLLILLLLVYAPFGLSVQAETDTGNETVAQMLQDSENAEDNNSNQDIVDTAPPEFENQFTWFNFVKMFFALAVVIALIYIILRFINKRNRLFGQMKAMENLGGISVGPHRSIQLVRIGETVLVVGVGETIQLLKEITSQEEIEKLISQNEIQSIQVGHTILNKIIHNNDNRTTMNSSSGKSFSHMLKGQLEDLAEGRKKLYDKIKRDQDE